MGYLTFDLDFYKTYDFPANGYRHGHPFDGEGDPSLHDIRVRAYLRRGGSIDGLHKTSVLDRGVSTVVLAEEVL